VVISQTVQELTNKQIEIHLQTHTTENNTIVTMLSLNGW